MTQPIQIRPVTTADFPAWLPLWDAYNAFYGRSGETALPRDMAFLLQLLPLTLFGAGFATLVPLMGLGWAIRAFSV